MKVSKQNQSKVSIQFKNPWTHMTNMHIDLKSLLLTWFKDKRHRWMKASTIIKRTKKLIDLTSKSNLEISMESTQEV